MAIDVQINIWNFHVRSRGFSRSPPAKASTPIPKHYLNVMNYSTPSPQPSPSQGEGASSLPILGRGVGCGENLETLTEHGFWNIRIIFHSQIVGGHGNDVGYSTCRRIDHWVGAFRIIHCITSPQKRSSLGSTHCHSRQSRPSSRKALWRGHHPYGTQHHFAVGPGIGTQPL